MRFILLIAVAVVGVTAFEIGKRFDRPHLPPAVPLVPGVQTVNQMCKHETSVMMPLEHRAWATADKVPVLRQEIVALRGIESYDAKATATIAQHLRPGTYDQADFDNGVKPFLAARHRRQEAQVRTLIFNIAARKTLPNPSPAEAKMLDAVSEREQAALIELRWARADGFTGCRRW